MPSRRHVLLAIGLALVVTPFWAPALELTGPEYEYRGARVLAEGEGLAIAGDATPGDVDGVACFGTDRPTYQCGAEYALTARNRSLDYPVELVAGGPAGLGTVFEGGEYVAFSEGGPVYRRSVRWNDTAGEWVFGLRRASPESALAAAAIRAEHVSAPARTAIESGSVRTGDRLAYANDIVEFEGRYYVVYRVARRGLLSAQPAVERLFSLVTVLAGALLIRRAGGR
jgi:hypothetical protein